MKRTLFLTTLLLSSVAAMAQNTTIDISGNNSSNDYKSYSTAFSIATSKTVEVKMARYCYFSSKITGKGTLMLYGGGERCYLGTEKGKAWPDWTGFTGDIHIYPFKENAPSAGFHGVVLAHGGKSSTADNAIADANSGKVNPSMANNKVTLHSGATICCEANNTGAGFRIGELEAEAGSSIIGYMKGVSPVRSTYFLIGGLNTDATLAGDIIPTEKNGNYNPLGIVKEGTGTYRITGNNNYLTDALRVLQGRVLVNNDRAEAEKNKLRGGVGAKQNENEAVVYVFARGVLGGTGSIGGMVDNYGTIEPGDDTPGTLTLKNYNTTTKNANLTVHPASVLRFKVASAESYDQLVVAGQLKYNNTTEDFLTSDAAPVIMFKMSDDFVAEAGTELTLLTAKGKTGDWQFQLRQPGKGTWALEEQTDANGYKLVAKLVSTDDADPNNPDNPDNPDTLESTMGAFYDDGINDNTDTKTLRYYAEQNGKYVGGAFCTYKSYDYERSEAARQFNMMVAENEMKMDALQPSQGQFTYGSADALVSLARNNNMAVRGHCLLWHKQQPVWVSSDGGQKNDKSWTRQQALDIMKAHITNVLAHFKGKVTEWDVVNECLSDVQDVRTDPDSYKLRPSVWQLAIGDDYVDSAFVYAHRADPTIKLYLNDYDVELQGNPKTVAYYNLAKHLQERHIPIDGVGLQCHFSIGEVDSVKLEKTIQRFGELGLKCAITELDLGIPSTSATNLEEQARNYRVITDIMLNNDNCPNLVIWGLKDNNSWREASLPLLYTEGVEKKPAYYGVRSALRHRIIEATNIQTVNKQPVLTDEKTYDLYGRYIQGKPLSPGILIKKGKKILHRK